jgi:hypothetical protein
MDPQIVLEWVRQYGGTTTLLRLFDHPAVKRGRIEREAVRSAVIYLIDQSLLRWTDGRQVAVADPIPHADRITYARVILDGGSIYTQPLDELEVLLHELREGLPGDRWTVELIAMTEADYNALPDFAGH